MQAFTSNFLRLRQVQQMIASAGANQIGVVNRSWNANRTRTSCVHMAQVERYHLQFVGAEFIFVVNDVITSRTTGSLSKKNIFFTKAFMKQSDEF